MMKAPLRPGTRPVDAAQLAVEDTSTDGPEFASVGCDACSPCAASHAAWPPPCSILMGKSLARSRAVTPCDYLLTFTYLLPNLPRLAGFP